MAAVIVVFGWFPLFPSLKSNIIEIQVLPFEKKIFLLSLLHMLV